MCPAHVVPFDFFTPNDIFFGVKFKWFLTKDSKFPLPLSQFIFLSTLLPNILIYIFSLVKSQVALGLHNIFKLNKLFV
jgi:hypothetical protein